MNFVILFLFSTIVFTVNSVSTTDNFNTIRKKNVDNLEGENSDTNNGKAYENKDNRVSEHSVSNSNGKKYQNEDKSVDTHAREIDEWIETLPQDQRYGARRAHGAWIVRVKGSETKLKGELGALRKEVDSLKLPVTLRVLIDDFFDCDGEEINDYQAEDIILNKYGYKKMENAAMRIQLKCEHILFDLYGSDDTITDIRNHLNETLSTQYTDKEQVKIMCNAITKIKFGVNELVHGAQIIKKDGVIKAFNDNILNLCINIFYKSMKPLEKIEFEEV